MEQVIWKFAIEPIMEMPTAAKILKAGYDGRGRLCLWALVDPKAPKCQYAFEIVATGEPIKDIENLEYFETVVHVTGLVWHIFERKD